jgi:hypothetical protein
MQGVHRVSHKKPFHLFQLLGDLLEVSFYEPTPLQLLIVPLKLTLLLLQIQEMSETVLEDDLTAIPNSPPGL